MLQTIIAAFIALIAVTVGGLFGRDLSGPSPAARVPQAQPLSLPAREAILNSLSRASTSSGALVSFDEKQILLGSLNATDLTGSSSVTAASGGKPISDAADAATKAHILLLLNNPVI
jgi:hypothetical protein